MRFFRKIITTSRHFFLHYLIGWFFRTAFWLEARGWEALPTRGGVLVAPNHLGYLDCLRIVATCPRPVRFLGSAEMLRHGWLRVVYALCGVIPTDPASARRVLRDAGAALARGEVVCLFPEGKISPDGSLQPLQRGVEVLARQNEVPVVPVRLQLAATSPWRGWLSRLGTRLPLLRSPQDGRLQAFPPLAAKQVRRETLAAYLGGGSAV